MLTLNEERKFQETKAPGNKSSRELKYQRLKVPLLLLGAKVRGNESFSYHLSKRLGLCAASGTICGLSLGYSS